jgi:hypothetical protein
LAKLKDNLGKIGVGIMVVGLARLFYDSYEINQQFPTNYRWYDHPDPIVPIVAMLISFTGIGIFIFNFRKGGKVI